MPTETSVTDTQADVCTCGPFNSNLGLSEKEWHRCCVQGIAQFLLDCYDGNDRVNSKTFWHLRLHLAGAR